MTEPFRGAPHTVEHIKKFAIAGQMLVRPLAEDIVGHLQSKDYLSEILAIYYWVCTHTRYANDPRTIELVRGPVAVLARLERNVAQLRSGKSLPSLDCDDLSTLLAALFLSLGREVRIVTVAFRNAFYNGQRQYQHVYIQVREPRSLQWIVLDPVAADMTGDMLRKVKAVKIWAVA